MMYLTQLMIDVGSNPDRPRPGRLWLRNPYHIHQRLSMAFPNASQCETDPPFLKPFDPAGFTPVNGKGPRFLFRVDNSLDDDGPRVMILVQSMRLPDWNYAFHNASMFLAAPPQIREYAPTFSVGDSFRFRIRVNPVKKSKSDRSNDGEVELRKKRPQIDAQGRQKDQGKRVALAWKSEEGQQPDGVIQDWFAAKAARCGFEVKNGDFRLLHLGWVTARRPTSQIDQNENHDHSSQQMRFRSALLEGSMVVKDAQVFAQALGNGIGSAKAFGFGLLSIMPM